MQLSVVGLESNHVPFEGSEERLMIFSRKTKAQPADTPAPPPEEAGLAGLGKSIVEADLPSRARDVAYKELARLEKKPTPRWPNTPSG